MIEPPNLDELLPLLRRARDEDLGAGDITTEATVPAQARAVGTVLAKQSGVLCGAVLLAPLARVYWEAGPRSWTAVTAGKSLPGQAGIQIELLKNDGEAFAAGQAIARLTGLARELLAIERVALNFLQRLSGVATATRAYVDAVAGTGARILDTRKTTPGLRTLEKYAVRCGGGTNHRAGLYDAILVKDNHIALAGGDLAELARSLRARHPGTLIEIEVDTLEQLGELLGAGDAIDMILLDNMPVEQIAEAVRMRGPRARPLFEASGGVTLETVRAIAQTGVERISVGAITHSAPAVDICLEM